MVVITLKDIQSIFGCTKRTAISKLKQARIKLDKDLREPVTVEQFYEVFGLTKTLKK